MSEKTVILVAGGAGTRIGSSTPKQFLEVAGRPILVHTIDVFLNFSPKINIVLVLPEEHISTWQSIKARYFPAREINVTVGGTTRYQSVAKGMDLVQGGLVAVHDAVRPCVSTEVIARTFESAEKHGSGIASVALKDSIRELTSDGSKAVDRNKFRNIQTPQTFQVNKLKEAFQADEQSFYTDDATVYEHVLGEVVRLVEGDYRNIKVTTPDDLTIVERLLQNKKP